MLSDRAPRSARRRHPWAGLGADDVEDQPSSTFRRMAVLGGWLSLLVAVLVGFGGLGRGVMAAPGLTDPGSWAAWAAARTAPEAAFAVARLGVQVIAGYLLVVTVLALAASVWQGRRLVSVVEILTFPAVRRMVQGMIGVSMAGASIAAVGAGPAVAIASPTVADVQLARADRSVAQVDGAQVMYRLPTDDVAEAPVMRLLDDRAGAVVDPVVTAQVPDAAGSPSEWVVQPGDHLWSVAEQVLTGATADIEITDEAVASYSEVLIEANLDRLADPGNPDLLFPGQVLALPAVPATG